MNIWLERLFLLLVFSLGFMQPSLTYMGMRLPATEFVFVVLATGLAVSLVLRLRRTEWDGSLVYFGLFALAMASSALLSVQPSTSAIKLVGVLYLVGLALTALHFISSSEMLRKTVLVWVAASTIAALIGTATVVLFYVERDSAWHVIFLHHYGSLPVGNYPRIQSTFIYPAMLCNYLTVGTMLTLGAQRAGWLNPFVASGVLALHMVAAVFTLTPGLGGFAAALAFWAGTLLFDRGNKGLAWSAVAAGFLAAAVFTLVAAFSIWPIETSPYTYQFLGLRLDPTQRLLAWEGSLVTFAADPFFGKGIGLGAASVSFRAPSGQNQLLTDAHNTWLSVAAQSGIIGLAAVVALCAHLIRRGWGADSPSGDIDWIRRSLLIAFLGCFVLQGFVGAFEDARHLWVVMGLILALDRIGCPARSA